MVCSGLVGEERRGERLERQKETPAVRPWPAQNRPDRTSACTPDQDQDVREPIHWFETIILQAFHEMNPGPPGPVPTPGRNGACHGGWRRAQGAGCWLIEPVHPKLLARGGTSASSRATGDATAALIGRGDSRSDTGAWPSSLSRRDPAIFETVQLI